MMKQKVLRRPVSSAWKVSWVLILMVLAAMISTPLMAQQTGELAGKVTNVADGSALANVQVRATSNVLPGARNSTTNEAGNFRMVALPPGSYTLTFTLEDGTTRALATEVLLQQRVIANLAVDLTADLAMQEEVLVTGTSTIFESSGSAISDAVSTEVFSAVPIGQEYRDLIKLIPGVQYTQDAIRGPSAGGNGQDNTYQFDGVDVSLPLFGTLSAEPSTHDIDQVSIVRGGATAVGFNRSGGFKVNTISKRGTDEFSGEVSYQREDSDWSASRKGVEEFDEDKDWIVASVGGPIVQEQLYFYASYYNPTVKRKNRANAYGEVPDYKLDRDEYFGKLTWAPTDNLLFDASYRHSKSDGTGEGVGAFEHPDGSQGSEATLKIAIVEGSWVINDNSNAYFKYTSFQNDTSGRPDLLLDAQPSIGGSLDMNNLDRMGHFRVPTLRDDDPAYNAWAQPLINRYGYVDSNGARVGGGLVGAAQDINVQDFSRDSIEFGYDISLDWGATTHDLHVGYHQEKIKEKLIRSSNGWGFIDSVGGLETTPDDEPIFLQADFFQTSLGEYGIPPINSEGKSQNIEINDSIRWENFTFNVGLLFSQDKLYGQGLKKNKDNLSGFENAPGHKYLMKKVSFGDMVQPRLGITWDFSDRASLFVNYARYYPSASSLMRAASWDRNLHTQIEAKFDATGNMIDIEDDASSSGKLFQEGIDPRHIDEFLIGVNWEASQNLVTRAHFRYRKARDFWEDTWNWSREGYSCTSEPDRFGCMPAGWAPEEPYIPELDDYRAEIGGSSYVIAQLDRSYTDYYEVSLEAEWSYDRFYLQGSYTWSDYTGNFDQDNATSNNDFNTFIGSSLLADGRGRQLWNFKDGTLRGERKHLIKFYGFYDLTWNATTGFYFLYQSGQPWETWDGSIYGYSSDTIRFAEPAGARRSEGHFQLDLNYTHNWNIGDSGRYAIQFRADMFNVFNKQTGYNIDPVIDNAGYGVPRDYYNPRRIQLMAKFLF